MKWPLFTATIITVFLASLLYLIAVSMLVVYASGLIYRMYFLLVCFGSAL